MSDCRLVVAGLGAAVVLLAGCSSTKNATPATGGSSTPAASSPSTAGRPANSPSGSAVSTDTASGSGSAPTSDTESNVSGPTPGDPSQPGGDRTARAYLAGKGWLDASGRVIAEKFAEFSNSDSDDSAFCSYVFGTLAQVRASAKLAPTATFDDQNSGDDNSGSFACGYVAGSDDVFVIAVGRTADIESGQANGADLVFHHIDTTYESALGYPPGTTTPTIDKASATSWLTAAAARIDLTGITKDS